MIRSFTRAKTVALRNCLAALQKRKRTGAAESAGTTALANHGLRSKCHLKCHRKLGNHRTTPSPSIDCDIVTHYWIARSKFRIQPEILLQEISDLRLQNCFRWLIYMDTIRREIVVLIRTGQTHSSHARRTTFVSTSLIEGTICNYL
jgi:hypothetical protein